MEQTAHQPHSMAIQLTSSLLVHGVSTSGHWAPSWRSSTLPHGSPLKLLCEVKAWSRKKRSDNMWSKLLDAPKHARKSRKSMTYMSRCHRLHSLSLCRRWCQVKPWRLWGASRIWNNSNVRDESGSNRPVQISSAPVQLKSLIYLLLFKNNVFMVHEKKYLFFFPQINRPKQCGYEGAKKTKREREKSWVLFGLHFAVLCVFCQLPKIFWSPRCVVTILSLPL